MAGTPGKLRSPLLPSATSARSASPALSIGWRRGGHCVSAALAGPLGAIGVAAFVLASFIARPAAAQTTATWNGGSGNWNTAANWSTGVVPNNGATTYDVVIDGNNAVVSTVTVNVFSTIDTLTVDANDTLTIGNNLTFTVLETISNNGVVEIASMGAIKRLAVGPMTTLSGNGQLLLANTIRSDFNFVEGTSSTSVLTNDTNHTIRGGGNLGNDNMGLVNRGLIDGTGTSYGLRIDPSSAGVVNEAIMQASSGGSLRLLGGTFDNTAGTIQALNGSVVYLGFADITGGTFATTDSGKFSVLDNTTCTIRGSITNNGVVEIAATSGVRRLAVGPTTTLTGTGFLLLANSNRSDYNFVEGTSSTSVLTNDTNHTILGGGNLGNNNMGLVNRGLIDGTGTSYGLRIDPSDAGVVNEAIMQASGGSSLWLLGGTFDNTAGTIQALNGSVVYLGFADITGGTFASTGSGKFSVLDNTTCTIRGSITNNGVVEIASMGAIKRLAVGPMTTLSGNGQLLLANTIRSDYNFVEGTSSTSVLTNDTNHTILGGGNLGNNNMGLVNRGLIEDTSGSYGLRIDPSSAGVVNEATGTMRGSGSAGLQLIGGTFNNQGAIEAWNGSNVTYATSAITSNNVAGVLTGGKWRSTSTGSGATITLRGSNIQQIAPGTEVVLSGPGSVLRVAATSIDSTLTTNQGSFSILEGRNFAAASTFSNTGTLTIGTGSTFTAPAITQLSGNDLTAGTWYVGTDGTLNVTSGANVTTNHGSVTLDGTGSTFAQIDALVDNRGSFAILNGRNFTPLAAFSNSGTLTIGAGSTFDATGGFIQDSGGTLRGSGTLAGNIENAGAIRPGSSPGIITIDGDLTQTATSVLEIEVGGLVPGTGHDQVIVTGMAALDGRLDLPILPGFVPAVDDEITFLTAASVTGQFAAIASSGLASANPNVAIEVVQNLDEVRLRFVEPRTDIQFDAETATADWESATSWNTGVAPDTRYAISIGNLAGTEQRVNVQSDDAFVHRLEVASTTETITIGVTNGKTLSAIVGTTIGDQAVIELDDGKLVSETVAVEAGGTLAGNGTVIGDVVVGATTGLAEATLSPGFSVGQLNVVGDYQQGAGGTLLVDVEGTDEGEFDTVNVTGEVTPGGTLRIDATNLASITPGTVFPIITAGSRTEGAIFDSVETVGNEDVFFAPIYPAEPGAGAGASAGGASGGVDNCVVRVCVEVLLDGDMNRNGIYDPEDVQKFALALTKPLTYFQQYFIFGHESGDVDDNGFLDFDDIDDFAMLMSGSGANTASILAAIEHQLAVPEPSSQLLILVGGLLHAAGSTRRRRQAGCRATTRAANGT